MKNWFKINWFLVENVIIKGVLLTRHLHLFKKLKLILCINWITKILLQYCYLRLCLSIETVFCHLLQQTVRMKMDWNWTNLGQLFQVLIGFPWEITKKIIPWLLFPDLICLISSSKLYRSILCTSKLKSTEVKPRTNGRNIVGCYMLGPFAHPVACCCVLLRKVWNRSNFSANNSQHFFCSVIPEA